MDPVGPILAGLRALGSATRKLIAPRAARRQQLREAMMSDAADFATGVRQALMSVRDAVQLPARQLADVSVVWEAPPEVKRLVDEAEARLSRVEIDFDADSTASREAEAAMRELRGAVDLLQGQRPNLPLAAEAADRAEERLRGFTNAAGEAIRK
jgi:hypothetical protein